MKTISVHYLIILPLLLLLEVDAIPCPMCSHAIVWNIYPPMIIWLYVLLIWAFIIFTIVSSSYKSLWIIPIILIFICASQFIIWAFPIFIVIIPYCLSHWYRSFKNQINSDSKYSRIENNIVKYSGIIFIAFILITITQEQIYPTPRTPADKVMRWSGTFVGRSAFNHLINQKPEPIEEYRKILRESDSYHIGDIAKRLQVIGNPDIDIPLIENAIERVQDNNDKWTLENLEEVLKEWKSENTISTSTLQNNNTTNTLRIDQQIGFPDS